MSRFSVNWIPEAVVEAAADKRGRPHPDDSVHDYLEVENYACSIGPIANFQAAIDCARARVDGAMFGAARIERVVYVESRCGDSGWRSEAVWELCAGDPDPVEDEPHWHNDVDLFDFERIVEK
jgi:hypothetical protein